MMNLATSFLSICPHQHQNFVPCRKQLSFVCKRVYSVFVHAYIRKWRCMALCSFTAHIIYNIISTVLYHTFLNVKIHCGFFPFLCVEYSYSLKILHILLYEYALVYFKNYHINEPLAYAQHFASIRVSLWRMRYIDHFLCLLVYL
jgi:hypothetical protein